MIYIYDILAKNWHIDWRCPRSILIVDVAENVEREKHMSAEAQ